MLVQKGSGIISIVIATGILLMIMSLIVRYTTYSSDIAHQRVAQDQQYFALRGLLDYGQVLVQTREISDSVTIPIKGWLDQYDGEIAIFPQEHTYDVHASIFFTPKRFITMQQVILKHKND